MKRTLRIIAAAALLLFLALSPRWLLSGLRQDAYRGFLARPAAEWHGRIELWHIAGFRTYQGSVTDYLEERADAYCKKRPGVHIDVKGYTEKQYYDRLARGVLPDAYSFPAGLVYAEQLCALTEPAAQFAGNLGCARAGDAAYAVPYLSSGYFLAANTQLMTQYGFAMPETADKETLQAALDLAADSPQLAMPAVYAARMGLTGTLAEADAFAKGKCMLAVLDARAVGDLLRGERTALLIDAVPFAAYTDETMYIGGAAHATPEQMEALEGFVEFLLTEKEQQRVSRLGALPVIVPETKVTYADELLAELGAACASPIAPRPFLYERHRAALIEEAALALTGDESARKAFFERLAVVESGEI